jgi:hypothetical protein
MSKIRDEDVMNDRSNILSGHVIAARRDEAQELVVRVVRSSDAVVRGDLLLRHSFGNA